MTMHHALHYNFTALAEMERRQMQVSTRNGKTHRHSHPQDLREPNQSAGAITGKRLQNDAGPSR